ncbi:hypothetical protein COCNU_05G004950 [Cocos nucifera]|uniref:Uncharacterized protein n=1 Tax=Cocos nucifera TaxID=13894 RepID=A0A8K0N200_COCNU|nr:hypothetical protein COCNU_05G004950 [Cocos nucifera]
MGSGQAAAATQSLEDFETSISGISKQFSNTKRNIQEKLESDILGNNVSEQKQNMIWRTILGVKEKENKKSEIREIWERKQKFNTIVLTIVEFYWYRVWYRDELRKKHRMDLENLTLTTQPLKTLQLFIFATVQYLRQSLLYIVAKGGWIMVFTVLLAAFGLLLVTVDGPHEKHMQEFLHYSRFVLWWVALGVASSIGLGSGLHTFVLYLGPHIALFTIKAMNCGRVDLKTAPYDTIQWKSGPSWLEKDCSEFGPSLYHPLPGSLVRVPISSILPQVQLEAILWGLGTALGELPPYFISRAGAFPCHIGSCFLPWHFIHNNK